jgi:hypothetical protein
MTSTADDDLSAKAAAATSSDSLQVRLVAASVKGWPCGESHGRVVYSDQVVAEARRLRALGMGLHAIARQLGVRSTTVADWLSGRRRVPAARVLAKLGPPRRDGADDKKRLVKAEVLDGLSEAGKATTPLPFSRDSTRDSSTR